MGQSIVTCRTLYGEFKTIVTLRRLIRGVKVGKTPFRGVLRVEQEETDSLKLAEQITREGYYDIGRAVPVLAEVKSRLDEVREAAVRIALNHVKKGESFCLRVHKRGVHMLDKPTPELEYEVGGAIYDALTKKHGEKPRVNLSNPEVTVVVEVLGKKSAVGVVRREWHA